MLPRGGWMLQISFSLKTHLKNVEATTITLKILAFMRGL